MASKNSLKTACLGTFLMASTLSGLAFAGGTENADNFAKNEYGITVEPHCSSRIKSAALKANGQKPTGMTASTPEWDLEIYLNPESKSWMLVGKAKNSNDSRQLCDLAVGTEDYTKQKWYQEYFNK